jgi:hypothetical protein
MAQPPTWALVVSDAVRYFSLRPWQPRLSLQAKSESLPQRVKRLRAVWENSRVSNGKRAADFNTSILEAAFHRAERIRIPNDVALEALQTLGIELALQNDNIFDFPTIDLSRSLTSVEAHHVTDRLIEVQTRLEHDERIHELFSEGLCQLFTALLDTLPESAFQEAPAAFTVPLYAADDPAALVGRFLGAFLNDLVPDTPDAIAALPFKHTRMQLWENLLKVSHMTPEQVEAAPHKIVGPKDCDLLPPEMVSAYLAGTPLATFAETPLPFSIPLEARFEHMHVVGGAGHGKTQTLQHLIATDLSAADPPSLIIIDSHGDMLSAIERLDLFDPEHGRLTDRLIIIDPEDVEHPPALNMFDMGSQRLANYTAAQREQVEAATIELYDYIFRALSADLTSKQGVAFAFVARLLLTMPGATIHTLRELMEDQSAALTSSPFRDAIARLDDTARAFFELHFFSKAFADTKRQIARRIYDFVRNKTFDRMFSSPVNKLDMFTAMNSGAIVLVNTSKALLKSAASALFGRYMIALTLRAAFERVAIPPHQRRPAFLVIDEAADYFDANVDALLTQVRKFKLGLVFAHQYLDQLDSGLRASFAANTAIKFAGGVSDKDARSLAPDMRCNTEFITGQRKHADHTTFAVYIRNVTPTALSLTVPFGTIDHMARMSSAAHTMLRDRNRARYATACTRTTEPTPASADPPVRDDEWMSGSL